MANVKEKYFYEFVEKHQLRVEHDFMHSFYYDKDGNEIASRLHGFAEDIFTINHPEAENVATSELVMSIAEHKPIW